MCESTATAPSMLDTADARLSAARRYLSTVPVTADWVEQIAVHLGTTAVRREQIEAALAPHREQIEAVHVGLLVKHLSATEIEALAQFQASPAGRSIMRKMGAFQAALVPELMPLLRGVVEAVLESSRRAAPGTTPLTNGGR